MQYEAFAALYDCLTFDVDYVNMADFIELLFKRYACKRPELVLDLACGTGSLTAELAGRGYDMTGADASAEMLAVAREKLAARPGVLLLEQDMRSFELYGTVDAIVCVLDSVNYVTEGLDKVFALAANYLNPGGVLVFDINSPYKYQHILADNTFTYETDGIFYVWENELQGEMCSFYLDFFVEQAGGDYRRYSEVHTQRVYDPALLERMLETVGLTVCGRYDGYNDRPVQACSERIVFACQKPQA